MPAPGSTWATNSWVPQWSAGSWADAVLVIPTVTAEVVALERGWYGLQLRLPGDVFVMQWTGTMPAWVALNDGTVPTGSLGSGVIHREVRAFETQDQRDRTLSGYHGVWVRQGFKLVRLP